MIIYRAFSYWNFFVSFFGRLVCVAFLVYLSFHYTENPPVIIIAGIIGLVALVFIGNGVITVYDDRVADWDDSISSFFIKSKVYLIKDIKTAYLPLKPAPTAAELGIGVMVGILISRAAPGRSHRSSPPIFIELKNGDKIQTGTNFGLKTQQGIVDAINLCIKKTGRHLS